ncbi:hypothetical protein [Streptomyces exfoliatus]|uniref:hypothetical protein n=1 Tax=Streptomyces exfoliatus TaxID=1905 RepID=UPI0037AFD184
MTRDGRAYSCPPLTLPVVKTAGSRVPLLPTPTASDGSRGPDRRKAERSGTGGDDLVTVIAGLAARDRRDSFFETPAANLGRDGAPQHPEMRRTGGLSSLEEWWGPYTPAVARWERLMGRPAPVPIERGPRGGLRLGSAFTEWLMGLPPGWVSTGPGLPRGLTIQILGNGVVPQQARTAYAELLGTTP